MTEKYSTTRIDFPRLKRARFSVRHSAKARPGGQIPRVATRSPNLVVSSPRVDGSENALRSEAKAKSPAPGAQAYVGAPTGKKSQAMGQAGLKKDLIERLKSPDWLVRNRRGEDIPVEVRAAMSSLITICRMLEKISDRLDNRVFGNDRERRHVESFSNRLLRSWAALTLVLECYNDDPGWARRTVSHTALEVAELAFDLKEFLERGGRALNFSVKSGEDDANEVFQISWLTRDAYDRYRALEGEVLAVAMAIQKLNEEFAGLPDRSKPVRRVGDVLFDASHTGAQRKPGPSTDKPRFPPKHASALTSLQQQASLIHECLLDLERRSASTNPQQQLVASHLTDAAKELQATILSARTLKAWETGLNRSRHFFLKAHAKLQDIASAGEQTQTQGLAIRQKVAAGIYASFDSVINIVLNLPSDGVSEGKGERSRRKVQSRNVSTISSPTTVTRRFIPANAELPKATLATPVRLDAAQSADVGETGLAKEATDRRPAAPDTERKPISRPANAGNPRSTVSLSPRRKGNAILRSQQLSVTWKELDDVAAQRRPPSV